MSRVLPEAATGVPESHPGPAPINPFEVFRSVRSAGRALLELAGLHGRLIRLEWGAEKHRLVQMLMAILAGFSCFTCALVFLGVLLIAWSWETTYRIPAVMVLVTMYTVGAVVFYQWFSSLAMLSNQSFSATREELAADLEVIKNKI